MPIKFRPEYRPGEPPRFKPSEPVEERLPPRSPMEEPSDIIETLSSDSTTTSTSISTPDSSGKSLSPQRTDPIIEAAKSQNTSNFRRIQELITRRMRGQQNPQQRSTWEESNIYLKEIEKSQLPPVYKNGMRLLHERTFKEDRSPVSKMDLMGNPSKYFSEEELNSLRKLQSLLLSAAEKHPQHKQEQWALERLLYLTPTPADREKMIRASQPLMEKDPNFVQTFVDNPNLPLSTFNHHLADAEGTPRADRDPYHKSRWQRAFEDGIGRDLSNTIERIDNELHTEKERLKQNNAIANSSRADKATRLTAKNKIREAEKKIGFLTGQKAMLDPLYTRLQQTTAVTFLRLAKNNRAR